MKKIAVLVALLAFSLSARNAQAAIEGYSNFNITNFQLFVDAGGGTAGAAITNGTHLTVVTAAFSSRASADIDSILGGVVTNGTSSSTPNPGVGFGLNTASAYEGPGIPPAQNDFSNLGTPLPHAHADTTGAGAIIAGLPGVAAPASTELVSEVDLLTALSSTDSGRADSSTTSSASFVISLTQTVDVVGIFTAEVDLLADLLSFPPGVQASANTSFNIIIRRVGGGTVFSWAPNGQAGGIVGGTEYLDPFHLNESISAFPGSSEAKNTGTGLFSAGFRLTPGQYTFNVESSTSASATSVGVFVPEPSTYVIWSVLAACVGGCFYRKNRS